MFFTTHRLSRPELLWAQMGVLAVEMESAALYSNAASCGRNAICILTVSDSAVTGEATTAEEREKTFYQYDGSGADLVCS